MKSSIKNFPQKNGLTVTFKFKGQTFQINLITISRETLLNDIKAVVSSTTLIPIDQLVIYINNKKISSVSDLPKNKGEIEITYCYLGESLAPVNMYPPLHVVHSAPNSPFIEVFGNKDIFTLIARYLLSSIQNFFVLSAINRASYHIFREQLFLLLELNDNRSILNEKLDQFFDEKDGKSEGEKYKRNKEKNSKNTFKLTPSSFLNEYTPIPSEKNFVGLKKAIAMACVSLFPPQKRPEHLPFIEFGFAPYEPLMVRDGRNTGHDKNRVLMKHPVLIVRFPTAFFAKEFLYHLVAVREEEDSRIHTICRWTVNSLVGKSSMSPEEKKMELYQYAIPQRLLQINKEGYRNREYSYSYFSSDFYACKVDDYCIAEKFISTSSIQINSFAEILRFVFEICNLNEIYLESLLKETGQKDMTSTFKSMLNHLLNIGSWCSNQTPKEIARSASAKNILLEFHDTSFMDEFSVYTFIKKHEKILEKTLTDPSLKTFKMIKKVLNEYIHPKRIENLSSYRR